jgi:hypothetical protein
LPAPLGTGARRRGGWAVLAAALALALPGAGTAAECAGDECQGPPPAPAEVVPGTAVVEGPENPPVHFPKPRPPRKNHGKHRGGGR